MDFKMLCFFIRAFLLLGFLCFDEVSNCPTTAALYKRTGESATLQFQATTVNPENPRLSIGNTLSSPNGSNMLTVVYLSDIVIGVGLCYGCTLFGNTATGDMSIRLDNLQTSNAGTYKLTDTALKTCFTIYILGRPSKPRISSDKDPEVSESVTLTCSSSSTTTPSDHGRKLTYDWRINNMDNPSDSRYSYSTSKHTLRIANVNKEDANKIITCTVIEDGSNEYKSARSDSFSPNVIYGPENMKFDPSDTLYELEENSTLGRVTCSATCNPPCSFKWTKILPSSNFVRNTNVLDLDSLTSSEAGTYRCIATRSQTITQNKDLIVNVIYGPRNMSFTPPETSYRGNLGSTLQVTCSSQCWQCDYSWIGPDSFTSQTAILNLGQLTKSMAGDYTCIAKNIKTAPQIQKSKRLKIEVRYGPDSVNVTPKQSNYVVDEDSTLNNIECFADCFPSCTYKWAKAGETAQSSTNGVLHLGTVQKSHNGTYTCTATNGDTPSMQRQISVSIIIRYGPYSTSTILTPETTQYTENDKTTINDITCSADCYPSCVYTWTKVIDKLSQSYHNGSILSLGQLTRNKAAKYICTVRNPGKTISPTTSKEVTVYVRYGPDTPICTPTKLPLIVTEGQAVQDVLCSSECYPRCSYTWKNDTDGKIERTNTQFSLGTANRYHAGRYTFTIRNTAQHYQRSATKQISVIVNYAPDVSTRLSSTNIREGANLTLFCIGSGFPERNNYVSLTQKWNNMLIQNTNMELHGTPAHSSIHFTKLQLQDTGLYTCTLNNGVRDVNGALNQAASINVTVEVSPKFLIEEHRFTGVTGEIAKIHLPVYSFPDVERVTVLNQNKEMIVSGEKYHVQHKPGIVYTTFYGTNVSVPGYIIEFTIFNLLKNDLGDYTVTATNRIGWKAQSFSVIAKQRPSPPQFFEILQEHNVPTFRWKGNFNGGLEQTFVLQITDVESNQNNNFDIIKTNIIIDETDAQYKFNRTFYTCNITSLTSGLYNARLYAYNEVGASEFVELATTFEVIEPKTKGPSMFDQNNCEMGTTIGLVVTNVIIAIYAVAVTFYLILYRRRLHPEADEPKIKEGNQATYVNVAFRQGDAVSPATDVENDENNHYTSLDRSTRDTGNTYDVVKRK